MTDKTVAKGIRFSTEDIETLESAAKERGLKLSPFVAGAAIRAARGDYSPANITSLRLEEIQADPGFNIRSESVADEELVASVKAMGVLEPILVRKSDKRLVLGFRRYDAARQAGLAEIPVVLGEWDDGEILEMQLVENLQREDLGPMEVARAVARLADTGLEQEEIAQALGYSQPWVANRLRLVQAPAKVQKFVEEGELSASHVTDAVLRLKGKKEQAAFAEKLVDMRASRERAINMAQARLEETRARQELGRIVQQAKVKTCPKCRKKPGAHGTMKAYRVEAKKVLSLGNVPYLRCGEYSWGAHQWDPDTGVLLLDQWGAQTVAQRQGSYKRAAKTREKKEKGERIYEPAWFFSRATLDWWLVELVNANLERLRSLQYCTGSLAAHVEKKTHLGFAFRLEPVEIDDGNGEMFHTRVLLLEDDRRGFRSGAREDHVAVGDYVQPVRTRRTRLLKFQRELLGGPELKKPKDFLPSKAGDFEMGQQVRLMDDRKSYDGKKARILAFDSWGPNAFRKDADKLQYALLDLSMASKVFPLDRLRPVSQEASSKVS